MGGRNGDDVAIEIERMLEKAEPLFTNENCVYRVPNEIRKLKKDAYTPKVISIGPFHYGDKRLQNTTSLKQIYCQKFIKRAGTTLDNLVSCVRDLEPKIRRCYSEKIQLSSEGFVKLILVDCCFIFEFFMRYTTHEWTHDDHAMPLKPWLTSNIRLDLLLLENQLPFFVLEKIYNEAFTSRLNHTHPSFLELTFEFFDDYNTLKLKPNFTIEHFTDLIRTFHLQPRDRRPSRRGETVMQLDSAIELSEAGVKLIVNKKSNCLLDLEFSENCLEIPEFKVEDWTEILFRNMVALEQCHYPDESYITDYVVVLDFLINTGKDVDLLVQKGIISNWIGDSNAVAKLYNGLWKNIIQVNFNSHYLGICQELNAYCKHPWHRRKATLRRDYCKTPWQTVASAAAIILLVLTIIQTVCSILQVVQQ
ncbi:UPF0481 protein At3g47200-like [Abrus precatorius]|uniref:UPF0481 protein At3g47200-like n=1 Tax=Abrus precatorius TaxID=3816 RepID=A0A8B8JLN9_ABRPR|nr:UPF0481 protein At3g47200-like [Abrus precatorius]